MKGSIAGALLVLCAVAAASSLAASAEPTREPDYVGHGRFDRQMRIELFVGRGPGGHRRVTLVATRVKEICDDGTSRVDFNPIRARLNKRGEFERANYFGDEADPISDQELYWVKGKLLADGRAKGFILFSYDPWDPPGTPNAVECSTFGKVRWDAKRVR